MIILAQVLFGLAAVSGFCLLWGATIFAAIIAYHERCVGTWMCFLAILTGSSGLTGLAIAVVALEVMP